MVRLLGCGGSPTRCPLEEVRWGISSSSVRGETEPSRLGGLVVVVRGLFRSKGAFLGAISSLCAAGGKCDQYWSAIGPVLVAPGKQYWSRCEVVLVTSPTSTGRKTDLVEGCRTDSCERLIVYGRLSFPLHSVSSSRGRIKSSLSTKPTRSPHSTWERELSKEKISL